MYFQVEAVFSFSLHKSIKAEFFWKNSFLVYYSCLLLDYNSLT